MSYNQSNRSEKIETTQYRKTDRRSSSSNQQRSSSGSYGKGGGGLAPSPSYNSSNSRSYKKNSNDAKGGQSRAHVPTVSVNSSANSSTTLDSSATTNAAAASTPRTTTAVVQNGSHVHPQLHGAADAPVTSAAAKPAEPPAPAPAAAVQRSTRPVPKAPTSQSSAMSSDPAAAPKTPVKAPGDASKPYPFQFGSISPGFMNGMQVPARTSSAPPNLDEQKRDQFGAIGDPFLSLNCWDPPAPISGGARQALTVRAAAGSPRLRPTIPTIPPTLAEIDGTTDNLEILNSTDLGSSDVGSSHGEKSSTVDASSSRSDSIGSNEIGTMSGTSDQQSAPIPAPDLKEATSKPIIDQNNAKVTSKATKKKKKKILLKADAAGTTSDLKEAASKQEGEDAEIIIGGLAPLPASGAKDKPILDQNKTKVTSKATKKKRKEILLKADAAGTTSDLYNAYKAHHDSFRPPHPLPIPTAPKQQFLRKDAVDAEQTNTGEAHSVPKVKKDVQVSPAPPASQPQKPPVLPPMGGMWPMQYHQPQVSVQFAGPNQQLQSQGMTAAPLQMQLPMGLSMANAPQVQPPMFLQPHPMQQGIIHQLGNMGMGPQLPPQLGNMGMGMSPPYPQQQGGKFGGPRKTTVKITHPDTHEELRALRLDKWADSYSDGGSLAPRSLPNIPPQSQPIPSFAPSHPLNFYIPNSFNAGSMFYPPQSSVPLTSSQLAPNSQAPRFNYPVGQNPQNMAYMNPSALNSLPVNKTGTPMHVTVDLPKHGGEDAEIIGGGLAPLPASGAKDKPILDQNKAKVTSKATKKKRKEILLKANAAGTTSDLYNAYKGPEEKKDTILSTDYTESISTCVNEKQAPADAVKVDAVASEMGGLNKAEPDDWEDAADLSTPKLEVSDDGQLIHGGLDHYDHDGDGSMAKKYSRDFLLKFSEQCTDLPEDFEIKSHVEALLSANLNLFHLVERDSYPSPGRIVDRLSAKKKGKEIPSKKEKEKKKRKEICLKADAAGTTSDLYNAYKGPKEKKDTILSTDYTESISTCVNEKQAPVDAVQVDAVASEMGGLNKAEPDDWEDAADLSTRKLEVSDDGQLIHGGLGHYDHDGDGSMAKKYS
ncbi:eukaryotic translation initiation factor 4G [Quercus suber]|uniref:eukaryotic translation initiation factor 4G n=1 Tax=Quercus suber TaxID=58331 RepID=UPI0032DFB517